MKKSFISLGLIVVATLALTNCAKEINPAQAPESAGIPFEITASSVDTKTTNDGMNTNWAANDKINLFHTEAGGTLYGTNDEFTITSENLAANKFTGELTEVLENGKSYDWYALYPYNENITTPGEKDRGYTYIGYSTGINQVGYNSMASLKESACPIYGVAKSVASDEIPNLAMEHLTSVVAILVTNENDEPLTVTTASLTAEEEIVGSYFINITKTPVVYTANTASKTATVNVTSGATPLAKGESAILYLAIKPFTAANGTVLKLSVNGYEKSLTLPKDVTFEAGKVKMVKFSYDKPMVENIKLPWFKDFSSKDLSAYVTSNTSFYEETVAGGKAPELYLKKAVGSLTASFDLEGYEGELTLVYLTNNDARIKVSTTTPGVDVTKDETSEYIITIPEGSVDVLTLVIKNIDSDENVRIDDLRLVKGLIQNQTLSFEIPSYTFEIGSEEAMAFEGQEVKGANTTLTYKSSNTEVASVDASTGKITWGTEAGNTIISVVAIADNQYKAATASYEITLTKPIDGDITVGDPWTYTFTAKQWTANGKKTLNFLEWTLAGDGGYWGWDSNGKGQQFGSGSKPYKTLKLSTSDYVGGVRTIKVSTSGASSVNAELTVTVNGNPYGSAVKLTSANTEYTFMVDEASMQAGEIVLSYDQTSSKALYIKAISINEK